MIKKGDFVKVDYVGMLADGTVYDTTIEEEAKKANMRDEKAKYKPVLIVVGKGQAIQGLEEAIEGMDVGKEKEINIPAEKGFGKKDPKLLNLVPLSRFQEENINPVVGMSVTIDNKDGIIKSVGGGRVVVDFNHPLAGQDLRYKIKTISVLERLEDKAVALFEDSDIIGNASVENDVLKASAKADTSSNYVLRKQAFLMRVADLLPEIKSVTFNEEYKIAEKKEKKERKEKEGKEEMKEKEGKEEMKEKEGKEEKEERKEEEEMKEMKGKEEKKEQ